MFKIAGIAKAGDFITDEAGEITVAWVVLVSAVIALGVSVMLSVGGGTKVVAGNLETELTAREVSSLN